MIVGNPRSGSIMRAAFLAHQQAGVSVEGQRRHWLATPIDPGKATFWSMALVDQCGVAPPLAYRLVQDLETIKRGW